MFNWFRRSFPFPFSTKIRDPEKTASIFNEAYAVVGFKELLENDVYFYKRKFIESKKLDEESYYLAEAYARILEKMVRSHDLLAKQVKKTITDI